MPPAVLKDIGIGVGQRLTLTTTVDGRILLAPERKFVLGEMIAHCDLKAPPPTDLALWNETRSVGREAL